jgi:hypothetical protein
MAKQISDWEFETNTLDYTIDVLSKADQLITPSSIVQNTPNCTMKNWKE